MKLSMFSTARVMATSMIVLSVAFSSAVVRAEEGDDLLGVSVIPDSVSNLKGEKIDFASYKNFVTTDRPMDDKSKIFLLYNVGTGKFLNTGSYFGLHAALGDVPRQFWLQRRNEVDGYAHSSYKRYPELSSIEPGTFAYDFFALTTMQVGNTEGTDKSARAHAIYNYVRYVNNTTGEATDIITPDTECDGTSFKKEISGFSFDTYRIEAQFNMKACEATKSGGKMETLLSFGQDVDKWDKKNSISDLHIYGYRQNGKSYIRVQPIDKNYNDENYKSGGSEHPINVDDDIVTVVITKGSILINGVECMPRDTKWTYTNTAAEFFKLTDLHFGSAESGSAMGVTNANAVSSHTYAIYNKVALIKEQNTDGKLNKSFSGNLSNLDVEAIIDLTPCDKHYTENILSVGEDIANWGTESTYTNLHFYYNAGDKILIVDGVNKSIKGGTKIKLSGVEGTVKLKVNADGVWVNDKQMLTADHTIMKSLCASSVANIQVGSCQGSIRSLAVYGSLTVTDSKTSSTTTLLNGTPIIYDETTKTVWEGKSLKGTALISDDAIDFTGSNGISADIDLSTCKVKNENIFSIGNDISVWGCDEQKNNIHTYYLGRDTNNDYVVGVVYVNKDYNSATKRAITIPQTDNMQLRLTQSGLYINDINIYPDVNPVPTVAYHSGMDGEVVRFKRYEGRVPFIDNQGRYIPVLPGDDGYDTAYGVMVQSTGYIYTDDEYATGSQDTPLFISSRFNHETTKYTNEGVFLSWTPSKDYQNWGTVGVYADRALPQKNGITTQQSIECARWHFEPAEAVNTPTEAGHNLYRIYLTMTDACVQKRSETTFKEENVTYSGTHRFYLQAADSYVYGNKLENYGGEYKNIDRSDSPEDAEAVFYDESKGFTNPDNALWKVISVDEYNELFKALNSEMTKMLDLTYQLRDPNFTREDEELSKWSMDESLDGKVRVGYDQLSKKKLTDDDYTSDDGEKEGTYYDKAKDMRANHARYMGVDVRNGGYGLFYQTVNITNAGWYAISCGGMSNVGAKLFVQYDKGNGNYSAPVSNALYALSDKERAWFNSTGKVWPYDQFDSSTPMPLYNALVAMNDAHAPGMNATDKEGSLATKYHNRVAFFIDPQVLSDNGGTVTLRFGIDVPQTTNVADADQWTVFDNFHLLFGGRATEPNLVLNEEFTDFDYLDNTLHLYDARPMHLNRSFAEEAWNTLILPVNLSRSDFEALFGANAKLAKLDYLTAGHIEFTSETENQSGIYLRAFQPYIAWIPEGYSHGTKEAYTAELANRADGGTTFTTVTVPEGHFYLPSATLEGKHYDTDTEQSYYSFATDRTDSEGRATYTYADSHVATGGGHDPLQAYGTLCKTYKLDSETNKNTLIPGRPTLAGCYVMKGSDMYSIKKQYGTKGFRCWFGAPEGQTNTTAASLRIAIDGIEDVNTQIADVKADTTAQMYANGVYSLSGMKLREGNDTKGLPAGIYIVNGMKLTVK